MATTRRRRQCAGPPPLPALVVTHGLEARFGRGDLVVEEAPIAGAATRTVRRLRRADPLQLLRPPLSTAQLVAADQLRDDHDLAEGVRAAPSWGGGATAPWQRSHYAAARADARARRTAALDDIEERLSDLHALALVEIVLGWAGLRGWEDRRRQRHGTAAQLLREALEHLAAHPPRPTTG